MTNEYAASLSIGDELHRPLERGLVEGRIEVRREQFVGEIHERGAKLELSF